MGYSISVQVKNKKIGQKMIDFLKKNVIPWDHLVAKYFNRRPKQEGIPYYRMTNAEKEKLIKRGEWYDGPFWADGTGDADSIEREGLSYIHRKGHIGFDYGSGREYKYTLLRWMAQKIGKIDPKTKHPRILYDDGTWIIVSPDKYNKYGIPINTEIRKFSGFEVESFMGFEHLETEIKRLDELWEKENA